MQPERNSSSCSSDFLTKGPALLSTLFNSYTLMLPSPDSAIVVFFEEEWMKVDM